IFLGRVLAQDAHLIRVGVSVERNDAIVRQDALSRLRVAVLGRRRVRDLGRRVNHRWVDIRRPAGRRRDRRWPRIVGRLGWIGGYGSALLGLIRRAWVGRFRRIRLVRCAGFVRRGDWRRGAAWCVGRRIGWIVRVRRACRVGFAGGGGRIRFALVPAAWAAAGDRDGGDEATYRQ